MTLCCREWFDAGWLRRKQQNRDSSSNIHTPPPPHFLSSWSPIQVSSSVSDQFRYLTQIMEVLFFTVRVDRNIQEPSLRPWNHFKVPSDNEDEFRNERPDRCVQSVSVVCYWTCKHSLLSWACNGSSSTRRLSGRLSGYEGISWFLGEWLHIPKSLSSAPPCIHHTSRDPEGVCVCLVLNCPPPGVAA